MIIIYPAGKINDYLRLGSEYPHLLIPQVCPDCKEKETFVRVGYYKRWVCTENGEFRVRIGRVRCKHCKASHALLPACLIPNKQSTTEVIATFLHSRVIEGKTLNQAMKAATDQEPSRQKGAAWIKSMVSKLPQIKHFLAQRLERFKESKPPARVQSLKILHMMLEMMFKGWQQAGEALAFYSSHFHREMKMALV